MARVGTYKDAKQLLGRLNKHFPSSNVLNIKWELALSCKGKRPVRENPHAGAEEHTHGL